MRLKSKTCGTRVT